MVKLQQHKVFNNSPLSWDFSGYEWSSDISGKGGNMHPSLRDNNLVTIYLLPESSCVIQKKAAYMDDETWAKVVKVLTPGIRKMKLINVTCIFLFYSLYI